MVSTLVGAVFNIIFDPILIFGLKWGMMGAAVATIAGQIITALLSLWYLAHMKAVKVTRSAFRLRRNLIRKFLPLGLTSLLSQISLVASMAAVNNMIREVVFGVGFALLLPILFGLDGVLYSMPVSDALTFVIAAFVIRQTMRELSE